MVRGFVLCRQTTRVSNEYSPQQSRVGCARGIPVFKVWGLRSPGVINDYYAGVSNPAGDIIIQIPGKLFARLLVNTWTAGNTSDSDLFARVQDHARRAPPVAHGFAAVYGMTQFCALKFKARILV